MTHAIPDDQKAANLRAALLMTLAMAGFAVEDMFIKLVAVTLPIGQILVFLGIGGSLAFGAMSLMRGDRLVSAQAFNRGVLLRTGGEVIGTLGFVLALALTPLATASAILQAMPLAVTLGAALFLGEKVGWRRWSAIFVGFLGVLLVIRPGGEGFSALSLLSVLAVIGLALRDVATRLVPPHISSVQVSAYALLALIPTGVVMMGFEGRGWVWPDARGWALVIGAQAFGVIAYWSIVMASRTGDVAVVAPFRYTRLVFALIVAAVVFHERPDTLTLVGAGIIVGSGCYTLLRQARLRYARPPRAQDL